MQGREPQVRHISKGYDNNRPTGGKSNKLILKLSISLKQKFQLNHLFDRQCDSRVMRGENRRSPAYIAWTHIVWAHIAAEQGAVRMPGLAMARPHDGWRQCLAVYYNIGVR